MSNVVMTPSDCWLGMPLCVIRIESSDQPGASAVAVDIVPAQLS
jgi:hypothetical protein